MVNGYEEFMEQPSGNDLAGLSRLTDALGAAEQEVAKLEAQLESARAKVTDLAERQIPELMDNLGMRSFVTANGFKVEVRKTIRASIPAARREEAMNWLDQHGHSGLIKRNISVAFNREQESEAAELQGALAEQFENVRTERKVEPSTLRAFIGEQLEAGAEVPLDLFGAWEQRVARVSRTD